MTSGNATCLQVTLRIDGGFAPMPGLAQPLVLDAALLSTAERSEMRELCEAALAVTSKTRSGKGAPLPDGRHYRLTIELDGSPREITVDDPVDEPTLAVLITFVQQHGRR